MRIASGFESVASLHYMIWFEERHQFTKGANSWIDVITNVQSFFCIDVMTAFYLPLFGVAEFIKIQQQMSFPCCVIFLKFALNDTEMKWLWLTYNEMHAFFADINSLFASSAALRRFFASVSYEWWKTVAYCMLNRKRKVHCCRAKPHHI